jgi:hypothetical protein
MAKEYTEELLIDFGTDGQKLLPVVTQDYNKGSFDPIIRQQGGIRRDPQERICHLLEPQPQ